MHSTSLKTDSKSKTVQERGSKNSLLTRGMTIAEEAPPKIEPSMNPSRSDSLNKGMVMSATTMTEAIKLNRVKRTPSKIEFFSGK